MMAHGRCPQCGQKTSFCTNGHGGAVEVCIEGCGRSIHIETKRLESTEPPKRPRSRDMTDAEMLKCLAEYGAELGRTPLSDEMRGQSRRMAIPTDHAYAARFGSWQKACELAGLTYRSPHSGRKAS